MNKNLKSKPRVIKKRKVNQGKNKIKVRTTQAAPTTVPGSRSKVVFVFSIHSLPFFCTQREKLGERKGYRMGNGALSTLVLVFLCFFSTNLVPSALAIWLTLPTSGTKCVSEEIQSNVVVLADYVVVPEDHTHNPTIAVKVPFFPNMQSPFSFVGPPSIINPFQS